MVLSKGKLEVLMMTEDVHKQVTKMEINYRKINIISFVLDQYVDRCHCYYCLGNFLTVNLLYERRSRKNQTR